MGSIRQRNRGRPRHDSSTLSQDERLLQSLLAWYRKEKRDLPWRKTRDAYAIWVSEIMLQQTQVSRAIDYYENFLARFPSVRHLSRASWPAVLSVWRGLGYYRRARMMLETAKCLVREHDAEFPKEVEELRRLPGIGVYTASAIACFAFGRPVPALDTNLNRVLSRYYGCPVEGVAPRAKALFSQGRRHAVKLNSALMDLGVSLCGSRRLRCKECPLQAECRYYNGGYAQEVQRKRPKKRAPKQIGPVIEVGLACIHSKGRYLLGKRTARKGGLWEFPGGKREKGESLRACLKREVKEELGIEVAVRPQFHTEVIQERNLTWHLHFCRCQILRGIPRRKEHEELAWVAPDEMKEYGIPAANKKAIALLKKMRG